MSIDYHWLYDYACRRMGSEAALEARLPGVKTADELAAMSDDRYLSLMTRRIFRAGLKHALVDARWPAFEDVFNGFDPHAMLWLSAEDIEKLMGDKRIIRHLGKLRSIPRNAPMILELGQKAGSFGAFLAQWPANDIVRLWQQLKKRGYQLGGLSAPSYAWPARIRLFSPKM